VVLAAKKALHAKNPFSVRAKRNARPGSYRNHGYKGIRKTGLTGLAGR
jgi:hypothetical protein